jgi:voltage-gated potassium channel
MFRAQKADAGWLDSARSLVSLPSTPRTLPRAITARAVFAGGLIVLATLIVYAQRSEYEDLAHPSMPIGLVAAIYYSTVSLSATGYGDIAPVTEAARLVNVLVIAPIRVIFLIVLIGTTLEVLAERTRSNWRLSRWRSRMQGHTVVIGYGTMGRTAISTLLEAGTAGPAVVVVDALPQAVAEANRVGLAAVAGDATRRDVLAAAEVHLAGRVVIAVGRDDSAVLIALTTRQLSSSVVIVAAVRETENEPLLRQCGATEVVVSAATAGRLLGMATVEPAAGRVMSELLDSGTGLDLTERPVTVAEVGRPVSESQAGTVALLRAGRLLAPDDPRAGTIRDGDRLIVVSGTAASPR